jgi:hypothetical protein
MRRLGLTLNLKRQTVGGRPWAELDTETGEGSRTDCRRLAGNVANQGAGWALPLFLDHRLYVREISGRRGSPAPCPLNLAKFASAIGSQRSA